MSQLDAAQVERLQQIGGHLSRLRESKKISLEKIARQTFIPQRLLEALEAGEVERLPEPVYVKGFIRRYADAIGLDGVELADTFDAPAMYPVAAPSAVATRTPEPVATPATPPERDAVSAPTPKAFAQPTAQTGQTYSSQRTYTNGQASAPSPTRSQPERPAPTPPPTPARSPAPEVGNSLRSPAPIAWIGLGALAAVGAIALLVNAFKPSAAPPSITASSPVPAAPSPTPTVSPSPAPVAQAPVQVAVKATEDAWISVTADDQPEPEFEGMMAKGETKTWTAKERLSLRAGNAGGVEVSYNQGPAKPLGEAGQVVDVTFNKDDSTPAPQ